MNQKLKTPVYTKTKDKTKDKSKDKISNFKIIILQHPQEPREPLSTVPKIQKVLSQDVQVFVGLSWPNLKKILFPDSQKGPPTAPTASITSTIPSTNLNPVSATKSAIIKNTDSFIDLKTWAVIYLGSGIKAEDYKATAVTVTDLKGKPYSLDLQNRKLNQLEGLVLLDGTWSQAKTLWWRNPWLTKLTRVILTPSNPSLYGRLRREPKKQCLSTLESLAMVLESLNNDKFKNYSEKLVLEMKDHVKSFQKPKVNSSSQDIGQAKSTE